MSFGRLIFRGRAFQPIAFAPSALANYGFISQATTTFNKFQTIASGSFTPSNLATPDYNVNVINRRTLRLLYQWGIDEISQNYTCIGCACNFLAEPSLQTIEPIQLYNIEEFCEPSQIYSVEVENIIIENVIAEKKRFSTIPEYHHKKFKKLRTSTLHTKDKYNITKCDGFNTPTNIITTVDNNVNINPTIQNKKKFSTMEVRQTTRKR